MNVYKILNFLRRIYWFLVRPKTTGVKCLVQNQDNEYLLIKTTYSGDYWTIPGGGCHRNESLENATMREVKEEVGIDISELKQLGSYTSEAEYKKDIVHLFFAKTHQTDIIKNQREISEAKWLNKDSLPQNRSRSLNEILLKL
ncbi:MAG: NUDIX hydrolase [Candidatus Pacebacteria bacterium]|jgi:ADP-ribose pyrophosphatase YjhB (NUDIX family)|nr:NUDIX hydrolase [Candidatus Paceibacterota bacterium]